MADKPLSERLREKARDSNIPVTFKGIADEVQAMEARLAKAKADRGTFATELTRAEGHIQDIGAQVSKEQNLRMKLEGDIEANMTKLISAVYEYCEMEYLGEPNLDDVVSMVIVNLSKSGGE